MAENKKSFILYADQGFVFDELTDEEAGQLIKHLFNYVRDMNPEEPEDRYLRLALQPIKRQLKRDLAEWSNEREERSVSGSIGNLKRWHPDLYKAFLSGKISLEYAVSQMINRKTSHSDNSDRYVSQSVANIAVNVNDNVNVNVNDTPNNAREGFVEYRNEQFNNYPQDYREKLKTKYGITAPVIYITNNINEPYADLTDIIYQTITDEQWLMQLSRQHSANKIKSELDKYIKWQLSSETFRTEMYLSYHNFKRHFVNKHLTK